MIGYMMMEKLMNIESMEHTVHLEQMDSLPDNAAIYHYDELNEDLKEELPELIKSSSRKRSIQSKDTISDGEFVKFTEYYQLTTK